jgi:hypothetical protein
LAVKEANAKKPIYTMHKWWARRLSCVFRTILLGTAIDWEDWDRLEPWQRDDDGDFIDDDGNKLTDEREYHKRVRKETKNSAWERLYYRLDDEANAVIRWAFTKPIGEPKDKERLADHLGELGVSPEDKEWWEAIDWEVEGQPCRLIKEWTKTCINRRVNHRHLGSHLVTKGIANVTTRRQLPSSHHHAVGAPFALIFMLQFADEVRTNGGTEPVLRIHPSGNAVLVNTCLLHLLATEHGSTW